MIGAEAADALEPTIRDSAGYCILYNIVRDDHLTMFYKAHIAQVFAGRKLCFFPRMKLVALPLYLFISHLKNGLIFKPKVSAKVAVPCLWGVFDSDKHKEISGVRRFTDDMYLYGKYFHAPELGHIFGDWDIPSKDKENWIKAMDARGIPHADRIDFGVNLRLLVLTIKTMLKAANSIFIWRRRNEHTDEIWRATIKGLYHYLLKHHEMENVKYKVDVVRNDYNPGHILATIAANQAGRKRIGISHVCAAWDAPQTCFVHFDRHITHFPLQEKWHKPFWDCLPIERIGNISIDSAIDASRRWIDVRSRLRKKYGRSEKWTVTILFPGAAERCLRSQWFEMYKAMEIFADSEISARIFLRFRRPEEAMQVEYMDRMLRLAWTDGRFSLEHTDFTTHELMAVSDVVITGNASFAINESIAMGKPVFTFDYTLNTGKYYGDYGSEFILRTASDVMRVLNSLEEGFAGADCLWEKMLADLDYHGDGKNMERLAMLTNEVVMEVA